MKRAHKNQKELKEVQILKQENSKLKKQISKLRKVISKLDTQNYQFVKDVVDSHERQDKEYQGTLRKDVLEEKWKCFQCEEGILRITILNRLDGTFYFRKCDECSHRTKLKKIHDDVDGV